MIIVEGPDGSGKTTLINLMRQQYPDLTVAPRVVSKQAEAMTDLAEWVDQNLAEGFQYKIFDRHRLVSEFIYGPILRQRQEFGFSDPRWVGGRLLRFDQIRPFIIYCLPPLDVVKKNIDGDEENSVVWDHIEGIYTAYALRAWQDKMLRPQQTFIYDYTKSENSADLGVLNQVINEAYERANA